MLQLTRRNAFTQQRSMYFIVDGVRFHYSDIVKEVFRGVYALCGGKAIGRVYATRQERATQDTGR